MDPGLQAIIAGGGTALAIKAVEWWLNRTGRQLAGRKDLREDMDLALKQIAELRQEVKEERERSEHLEIVLSRLQHDYDELLRRYNVMVIDFNTLRNRQKE